ncbi:hypothetical protein ACHAXN_003831 [Cyclotella atomus]
MDDQRLRDIMPTLCYDLDQHEWVESGLDLPPSIRVLKSVTVLSDGHVLVTGVTHEHNIDAVFKLNVATGQWIRLPNLPLDCGDDYYFSNGPDGMLVVFNRGYWAFLRTMNSEAWEDYPDLRGAGLRAFWFERAFMSNKVKVFAGNRWVDLPAATINGMKLILSNYNIVR